LLCICYTQVSFSQPNAQELILSGKQNIKSKNYKLAIADFEKVLIVQPTDTAALGGIIKACLLSEDLKGAETYINTATSNYPDNSEYILRKGILNNIKGEFESAIKDFDNALTLNPTGNLLVQIYLNRASSYIRLENYENAIKDYSTAIDLSPRNPNFYNQRGFAYYRTGNFSEAISDFTKTLDLDPQNASAFYNRGMAYLKSNDKSRSCYDFHKACNLKYINACKMIMAECAPKK